MTVKVSSKEEELKEEKGLLLELARSNHLAKFRKFPKYHRLLKKPDFEALRKNSKSFKSGCLLFFYNSSNGLENSRIGLAITRKSGSAVVRNKLKRLIRELYRSSSIKNQSFDFVVTINNRTFLNCPSWKEQKVGIIEGFQAFESKINSSKN